MSEFGINLDDKPALLNLLNKDKESFKEVVGTFVNLMEVAAEKRWNELPKAIHTSLSFTDLVTSILTAVLNTSDIDETAYAALELDLHPLALLSDKRKNIITGESEVFDWRSHFVLDESKVTKETIEHIIRKILYLVRWFDVESVSKALITQQFPVVDAHDIKKLPFQPALMYQKENLGDLFVGKFFHDIGAFQGGEINKGITECPACHVGELKVIHNKYKVCPRCNIGLTIKEDLKF